MGSSFVQRTLVQTFLIPGDICGLYCATDENRELASGVVSASTAHSITLSFDSEAIDVDEDAAFHIVKLANDVTYRRLKGFKNIILQPVQYVKLYVLFSAQ